MTKETRSILLEWHGMDGDDPADPYFRLVGIEHEPGMFGYKIEIRGKDAMGDPCWIEAGDNTKLDAWFDLAFYLFVTEQRLTGGQR